MPPDVSVIIPAYRARHFIHRAIDSALGQQGVDLEVIVVDDGCPERTGEFVRRTYEADNRVVVLQLERNRGPAAARNAGFTRACGAWLAVLDADDTFGANRLARLLNTGKLESADVVADNVAFLDMKRDFISVPQLRMTAVRRISSEDLLPIDGSSGAGMDLGLLKPIFRRTFLSAQSIRYREDVRHGEDFVLYFDLLRAGARFFVVPEVGYFWTLRSSGISQTAVDYLSQADLARELMANVASEDPRLAAGLKRRAEVLTSYQREYELVQLLKRRRVLAASILAVRRPRAVVHAARSYISKRV